MLDRLRVWWFRKVTLPRFQRRMRKSKVLIVTVRSTEDGLEATKIRTM